MRGEEKGLIPQGWDILEERKKGSILKLWKYERRGKRAHFLR
jgi:hypothetical protein